MSLGLVQKHHPVTYNIQYGNELVVNSKQQKTFKINKDGIFYHGMRHLIQNKKNAEIMVNDSCHPIPQVDENKKQYIACDVKSSDSTRRLQNITGQTVNQILHAVYNNIL